MNCYKINSEIMTTISTHHDAELGLQGTFPLLDEEEKQWNDPGKPLALLTAPPFSV